MGKVSSPEMVNLVIFMFSPYLDYWFKEITPLLEESFGKIDYISKELDFGRYTTYYDRELGPGSKGKLIGFERLIHPSLIADVKLKTNQLEMAFAVEGKRKFNLDPGYIHHMNFVLASTKSWTNRIYVGKGVYAEITLMYLNGSFRHWEFTYPNYANDEYKRELEHIRNLYLEKRRLSLEGVNISENRNKGIGLSKERSGLRRFKGDSGAEIT